MLVTYLTITSVRYVRCQFKFMKIGAFNVIIEHYYLKKFLVTLWMALDLALEPMFSLKLRANLRP